MKINQDIKDTLKEGGVNMGEGLLYLLGIYHGLEKQAELISEKVQKSVNVLKIVERDYDNGTVQWNIPLYEGEQTDFDWVVEWHKPFGQLNRERKSVAKDCIKRMKQFFADNPDVRKEEVFKARYYYLNSVENPKYLKKDIKFIYEGAGKDKTSMLLQ